MKQPEKTNPKPAGTPQNTGSASQTGPETPIYLSGNSTLQTPQEAARDKVSRPDQPQTPQPSNDDLHTTNADRMAGSDRAGTSERKP